MGEITPPLHRGGRTTGVGPPPFPWDGTGSVVAPRVPAPPMPSAARRRSARPGAGGPGRRRLFALAAFIVVAAVAAAAWHPWHTESKGDPGAWDPAVAELVEWVEVTTGRGFDRPVTVEFLDSAEYLGALAAVQPPQVFGGVDPGTAEAAWRALGISGSSGSLSAVTGSGDSLPLAVFDADRATILLDAGRGGGETPSLSASSALVDVLVTVLAGQVTPGGGNADQVRASRSMAMGQGALLAVLWEQELADADAVRLSDERATGSEGAAPAGVVAPSGAELVLLAESLFGPPQAANLFGGADAEGMWPTAGPGSLAGTVSVFNLASSVSGSEGPEVGPVVAPPGEELLWSGTFGTFGWAVPLSEHASVDLVRSALSGWTADSVALVSVDGRVCLRAGVEFADAGSATAFTVAAGTWFAQLPPSAGASVLGDGRGVDLTTCEPLSTEPLNPTGLAGERLAGLAEQNELALDVAADLGIDGEEGLCIVGGVSARQGWESLMETAGDLPENTVASASVEELSRCAGR